MKKIGHHSFPETLEEESSWVPSVVYTALHSKVLLVAVSRVEGAWACYCVPVPGLSHDSEKYLWEEHGVKTSKTIAMVAFPYLSEVPYAT